MGVPTDPPFGDPGSNVPVGGAAGFLPDVLTNSCNCLNSDVTFSVRGVGNFVSNPSSYPISYQTLE